MSDLPLINCESKVIYDSVILSKLRIFENEIDFDAEFAPAEVFQNDFFFIFLNKAGKNPPKLYQRVEKNECD